METPGWTIIARQVAGEDDDSLTPIDEIRDQRSEVRAVIWALFAIAATVFLMRLWVRLITIKSFGIDDALMCFAMVLCVACHVCYQYMTYYGMGIHIDMQAHHPEWNAPLTAWRYFYSIIIILAYSVIKLSITQFLLRLAKGTKYQPWLRGIQAFLVAFTIGSILAIILRCQPVAAGWDVDQMEGASCYNMKIFGEIGVFNSSINIATDLLLATLPIPMLWRVQIANRTKIGIICILSLGYFAAATAIYKTPIQYHFFSEPDGTGKGSWYFVWQIVEMNVGIVAACLPTLQPMFSRIFKKIQTSSYIGRTGPSHYTSTYGNRDYAMQDFGNKGHTYDAQILSKSGGDGKKPRVSTSMYAHDTESNEKILGDAGSAEMQQDGGIVRTTEVRIS